MHHHGFRPRKFGRRRDQRRALIKGLADSLVLNGSVETTMPRAKVLQSYIEKLITKAKKGDIHSRRQIIADLNTKEAAHKLVDELAPSLKARSSGYLRVKATDMRRGDGAQMAKVSFVDDLSKKQAEAPKPAPKKPTETKPKSAADKKVAAKK
jgi:large subunit ribosomal protein L17